MIEEALSAFVNRKSKQRTTTVGRIKSIDGDFCTVEREGLPDLEDVRLNAVNGDFEDVFIIYPKVGSEVMVLQVENAREENSVVKWTEIDRVYISIGGAKIEVSGGKIQVKNTQANLKEILTEWLDRLNEAIIKTPSGPGQFSPGDKAKFIELREKVKKLFK